MENLPLAGVRIADFTWVYAGPYCTQLLSHMGAEVIKIESSVHVDINRRVKPHADGLVGEERGGSYHAQNAGKKSCSLNLAKPEAIELAKEIIKISDVVVENFGYGVMERFGLGYAALKELKPNLIMVSLSPLGRTGPEKAFVGYNEEVLAYSGQGILTGTDDGPPVYGGGFIADYAAGTHAAFAILAALYHRSKTGQGQYTDISMAEVMCNHISEVIMEYSMNQRIRVRTGNKEDGMAPHGCYPTSGEDKWIAIVVSSDEEWAALCQFMGNPLWSKDAKFSNEHSRSQNQEELDRFIAEWTKNNAAGELMERLQNRGIAAGPSYSLEEVCNDPHLNERGFFVAPEHPEVGRRSIVGLPWKMSTAEPRIEHAPILGEHNEYVFCELLGMPIEYFATLVSDRVII